MASSLLKLRTTALVGLARFSILVISVDVVTALRLHACMAGVQSSHHVQPPCTHKPALNGAWVPSTNTCTVLRALEQFCVDGNKHMHVMCSLGLRLIQSSVRVPRKVACLRKQLFTCHVCLDSEVVLWTTRPQAVFTV